MSILTVLRTMLGAVVALLAVLRLAEQQHWSVQVTVTASVVSTIALLALAFFVSRQTKEGTVLNRTGENKPKKLSVIAVVFFGGVIVAFTFIGGKLLYETAYLRKLENAESNWPTVDATIVADSVQSSTSKGGRVTWSPLWTYSYAIEGRTYLSQSNAVPGGFDARWYPSKQIAEQDLASRAIGDNVLAYYDPADPRRSVLDRRTPSIVELILLGLSVLCFAFAIWVVVMLLQSLKVANNVNLDQRTGAD